MTVNPFARGRAANRAAQAQVRVLMTPQERRGKRLFLALATLIILDKAADVVLALSGNLGEVPWFKSILRPVAIAATVAYLWEGDVWLRWVVGCGCLISAAVPLFVAANMTKVIVKSTPPDGDDKLLRLFSVPLAFLVLHGLLYLVAGLLFLFSPAIKAFLRYQREGPADGLEVAFHPAPPPEPHPPASPTES